MSWDLDDLEDDNDFAQMPLEVWMRLHARPDEALCDNANVRMIPAAWQSLTAIIFLDDGVLHPRIDWFQESSMTEFRRLVDMTGARIVLSSSRRMVDPLDNTSSILEQVGIRGLIGVTPDLSEAYAGVDQAACRAKEIEKWLDDNPGLVDSERWLAIDNLALADYIRDRRAIMTNGDAGLNMFDADRAIMMLGAVKDNLIAMPVCFSSAQSHNAGIQQPVRILAFGDSLTAGYCYAGQRFEPYGRTLATCISAVAVDVFVCGLTGWTTDEMLDDIDNEDCVDGAGHRGKGLRWILKEFGPFSLVILMAGTNDLDSNAPEDTATNLESLHTVCHEHDAKTIALAVPPSGVSSCDRPFYKDRLRVNKLLEEWCASKSAQVEFVDTDPLLPFAAHSSLIRPLWDIDNLHLSVEGSRTLGSSLAEIVQPILVKGIVS